MQRWDSLPCIHPDELCLSLPLRNAEDNRMFCTEPMASCTHPLLSVYLVLDNSLQTQQNQEQGCTKCFLTLFLCEDTGLFPLLPGKGTARPSSARICHKNAAEFSSIPALEEPALGGQICHEKLVGLHHSRVP